MDPSSPIQVNVQLDSPDVISYRLFFKRPSDSGWTVFANGTDEDAATASGHTYTVGPLPSGSKIGYRFLISGNPVTAFRIRVDVGQHGSLLPNGHVPVAGTTDGSGVAVRQGEVSL
jgi:hypothetical protein